MTTEIESTLDKRIDGLFRELDQLCGKYDVGQAALLVQIDLSRPVSGSWHGRGFGRHYVWHYLCSRGHTVNVRCSAWRGFGKHRTPDTIPGAIMCPQCDLDT